MPQTPSWVEEIEPDLLTALDITEWKTPPPFDHKRFAQILQERLDIKDLTIQCSPPKERKSVNFSQDFLEQTLSLPFSLPPAEGLGCILIEKDDANTFLTWTSPSEEEPLFLESDDLVKGFTTYLLCEGLSAFSHLDGFQDFTPKVQHQPFLEEKALSFEITFTHNKTSLNVRLLLSHELYTSIETHFANQRITLKDIGSWQDLRVQLGLSAGSTSLTLSEWKTLNVGDCLCLDFTHFHPAESKGSFQLTLQNRGLFQVKLRSGELKILDHIYHARPNQEYEEANMDEEITPPEENEPPEEQQEEVTPLEDQIEPENIALQEIPFQIQVEVTRIEVTLEQLEKMQPGYQLPLDVNPKNVRLVVNDKAIGTGELIEIGDTVGVRVLEIFK